VTVRLGVTVPVGFASADGVSGDATAAGAAFAGTSAGVTPAGTPVSAPVAGDVVAQAGVQSGASNLSATFDGTAVGPGVVKYEESPIFKVTLPANIFGDPINAPGGVYEPGADAGYYAMIKNVLPGTHTLNFTGTLYGLTINSTYILTVAP